jgi:hypothetical protein
MEGEVKEVFISDVEDKSGETPFGKTAWEIIAEAVAEYKYPICRTRGAELRAALRTNGAPEGVGIGGGSGLLRRTKRGG